MASIDVTTVQRNLDQLSDQVLGKAKAVMQTVAIKAVNQAKDDAPWTDRTGNARRSIHTDEIDSDGKKIIEAVGIGVTYGVFLELAHGGRFRTIEPTVQKIGPIMMNDLKGIL